MGAFHYSRNDTPALNIWGEKVCQVGLFLAKEPKKIYEDTYRKGKTVWGFGMRFYLKKNSSVLKKVKLGNP